MREYGLPYYKPHPKQDLFHRAALFKRRMVRSGNRFGKSAMGCSEDCAWLVHERPWYPKSDPIRTLGLPQHPTKGLVLTTDWDKVDEIFTSRETGKLWKLLPSGYVKSATKNHSGVVDNIVCQDGSILRFDTEKAFLSNEQSAESSDWDFIHVDEPIPEDMWKAHSRGLVDRNGSAWFTLTPLRQPWITDFFFPHVSGTKHIDTHQELFGDTPFKWAISGRTEDNTYLSAEAIAIFAASLTPEEQACRLEGLPLHLSGRVYREFDYSRHVLQSVPSGWVDFNHPPASYTIWLAIDTHPRTPHAVLFCAVSPTGHRFWCNEIFEHTVISDLAGRITQVRDRFRVCAREICEPGAWIENPVTDQTMADEFVRCGVNVEKATKDLSFGILKVKEELSKKGEHQLDFFSPNLKRTLWEFEHYEWSEKNPNKPVDKDDHMMECLYRLMLEEPYFIPPDSEQSSVKEPDLEITKAEVDEFATADFD